jgi:hypothetical protein
MSPTAGGPWVVGLAGPLLAVAATSLLLWNDEPAYTSRRARRPQRTTSGSAARDCCSLTKGAVSGSSLGAPLTCELDEERQYSGGTISWPRTDGVNDCCVPTVPEGFAVGHWTDVESRTGCTGVIASAGTRGAVEVRGGGTGTRELEALSPLANAEGATAVLLTGGSAFGLAAADGVVRWLERRGLGRPTTGGVIPLVPAAVVFDLPEGEPGRRPGAQEGYAACEAAAGGVPRRGRIGAGAGAAVGKVLGRERATQGGVGYAATRLAGGELCEPPS